MSKFSNLLRLITLLKSNERMKRKDLAEALGVSERMIRKYMVDLAEANINVVSISGPNGGYELKGYEYLLNLNINDEEIAALELALDELNTNNDTYINNLMSLRDKIKINNSLECDNNEYIVYDSSEYYMERPIDYELSLQSACVTRKKVRVSFNNLLQETVKITLNPYLIVSQNDKKYLIAYCEDKKNKEILDISTINMVEVLNDTFDIDNDFNIDEYFNNTDLLNKKEDTLKLIIRKPISYVVSKNVYYKNQVIKWRNDESIVFESDIPDKEEAIKWILSMGKSVTIIKPISLKEEIKEIIKEMLILI